MLKKIDQPLNNIMTYIGSIYKIRNELIYHKLETCLTQLFRFSSPFLFSSLDPVEDRYMIIQDGSLDFFQIFVSLIVFLILCFSHFTTIHCEFIYLPSSYRSSNHKYSGLPVLDSFHIFMNKQPNGLISVSLADQMFIHANSECLLYNSLNSIPSRDCTII